MTRRYEQKDFWHAQERLLDMGVLAKDTHETTVRLAPPLCVTQEDLDWASERIIEALTERLA